ncbi:MAG: hypothetical protein Q8Q07_08005 [Dehalococcoidales bacterium]|nr:hypothetical protein [Dehalococcoidales bacterium]
MLFFPGDPFSRQREVELETRLRYGSGNDPERPPGWQPGNKYPVLGMFVGMIAGGAAGITAGIHYFGSGGILIGFVGGSITGGIIGTIIGDLIRKRRLKTKTRR